MRLFSLILCLLTFNVFARDIILSDSNTVSLRGPVTDASIADVISELNTLSKIGNEKDPIYLILNTPGGSVMAGIQLMDYMNTLRRPVHSVANFAASMGFQILQSSPVRYITKYGTIMSHRIAGGVKGQFPQEVNSRLKHISDLGEVLDKQAVKRTKGKHTLKSYMELIRDEYWAVGDNSIKDGFVDEVATLKCDTTLDGTVTKLVQVFIFVAEVEFSKCPIVSVVKVKNKEQEKDTLRFLSMENL